MIIQELNAIQKRHGYIPEKDLYELATRLGVPVYELHGVASFYPHYRLEPGPRVEVRVCSDVPCRMRGCESLRKRIEDLVRSEGAGTVEVAPVSCLGQCDGAPAVLINDKPYARKAAGEILDLVETALRGEPLAPQHFEPLPGRFRTDPYETEAERYGTVRRLVASGEYDGVIPKLKDAGLKGMGGAGFPTAIKWETVRSASSPEKYIVCNADESEVGTFKDREILKSLPYLVVEGMAIGSLVTGAARGFLYIRHEYEEQIEVLEEEIHRARRAGVLGKDVLGSGRAFELELFVSPGGYVQGEESALMEAIEGKRGQPRNKPWDLGFERGVPALAGGLWGCPTVINNVETLAYVPAILAKGADWFKSQGINGSTGVKWIGVSGDIAKPGVFEVPMGTTYLEVFNDLGGGMKGGKSLKAFAPSGPSFGIYPASMAGLKLDFGTRVELPPVPGLATPPQLPILGSGAIVAIAEGTCVLDLALGFVRFFRNESCGKCVPCRVGSQKMADIVESMTQGNADAEDLAAIDRLADTLNMTSICGLGQVVGNPILTVLMHFRDEVEDHMTKRACPSGVCFRRGTA